MITPRFSCSQTDISIVVSIYCPSVRASDVEIHVDESILSVHIAPYFLRLNFPGNVLEDDHSSAVYDPAAGFFTVTLTKETRGQNFPDLDLLAKLLAPKSAKPSVPVIEVLNSEPAQIADSDEQNLIDSTSRLSLDTTALSDEQREIFHAAENDWQLPQTVQEPLPELHTSQEKRYGFLDLYTGYFRHVGNTENEINELGTDAETLPPEERRRRRVTHEEQKWDEEAYMADYAEAESIDELLAWMHPHLFGLDEVPFSDAENMQMLRLPRKEFLASPSQTRHLYLTLLTLLFAFAYDARTTQSEPTPESAWTICALTPAFSALDPPPYRPQSSAASAESYSDDDLAATLIPAYRRSLSFPLYRSWSLSEACRTDVAHVLKKGMRTVVRCLLEMRAILDAHEVYYVYSRIWMDDFCSWVQAYANEATLKQLGKQVEKLHMQKSETGWNLEDLEAAVDEERGRDGDSDDESEDEVERMVPAQL
ncbi:SHQ1-domain-containing protein [Auriscalpium vulgare]|uniref:SHQ1-domain-containing protein n=1 Tax=Auriscalpium vulgare TaxID=40419 RepID=A0ACB8S1M0_9AGAM|nr:SHQ1-domain-containing protein [Auriscalpium vulgare]